MFSIVIPVVILNDYISQNITYIKKLNLTNWELIIVTNNEENNLWVEDLRIKLISSGSVSPATKRDLGVKKAKGDFIVFLDDDSYPDENLLNVAASIFNKYPDVTAIGGPAITPIENNIFQKASGAVFLSRFSGGNPERYLPRGDIKVIDDWPSVNFIIKKKEFEKIGGFDTEFWPGEDTFLCYKLIKESKIILYVPSLLVWHHRRTSLLKHIKQVYNYGLHRGFFYKRFPENSRKLLYLIPSILLIYIILGYALVEINLIQSNYYLFVLLIYLLSIILSLIEIAIYENIIIGLVSVPYIVLTHISYGYGFLNGIFTKKLISKLRK